MELASTLFEQGSQVPVVNASDPPKKYTPHHKRAE